MREWRVMLGPFLIWAVHFVVVYSIASVADVTDPSLAIALRTTGLVATAFCGVALAVQFIHSRRQPSLTPLARQLASTGFAIGVIAVGWQSLPLIFSA